MFGKAKVAIGIDIGSQTIKMAKLKLFKGTAQLLAFAVEQVGTDLTASLRRAIQGQEIKKANISVSGPSVITRYVNLPQMTSGELASSLKFEAQKHIPFSISEVNLDSSILKPSLAENKMLVVIAAVKKEFVNQRLKLLQDAGLGANIIDIDSLALINAFNFCYDGDPELKEKTIALLNIGAALSNLNILEGSIPRLSRDIQIAGNNFTQKLQEVFAVNFESAEGLKLKPREEDSDKITQAVESVLINLTSEIRTSFDYYESQSASSVAKIFLSGGGGKFNGIKEALMNILGIEVEYWDPLKNISIGEAIDIEKVKEKSLELGVAIGVALRSY